jgi:hypothetical protein
MGKMVPAVRREFKRGMNIDSLHDRSASRWWKAIIQAGVLPLATPRKWDDFCKAILLTSQEVDELASNYGRPFGREALAVAGTKFGLKTLLLTQRSDSGPKLAWVLPKLYQARRRFGLAK